MDAYFTKNFGRIKTALMDSWLEMSQEELTNECKKQGLTTSEKHIENIQMLLGFVKKFEAQADNEIL
jgi:RNase P/RNase MRP subunit POP5